MKNIFNSSITTNILLIVIIICWVCWHLLGKQFIDNYFARKGSNRADKEDISDIERSKKEATQPYDIELEKQKAQAAYIVEEYKETLKIRIEVKRKLYDYLTELKVNTRKFYYRSKTTEERQRTFEAFMKTLEEISDFMSCNKHFINEIDPSFLTSFEKQVNQYMKVFEEANTSISSGNPDKDVIEKRNEEATKLLDLIDEYIGKIFFINPSEVPYNKSMHETQ